MEIVYHGSSLVSYLESGWAVAISHGMLAPQTWSVHLVKPCATLYALQKMLSIRIWLSLFSSVSPICSLDNFSIGCVYRGVCVYAVYITKPSQLGFCDVCRDHRNLQLEIILWNGLLCFLSYHWYLILKILQKQCMHLNFVILF